MIYTFYSFKGGVGRSMALVNVAELLYRRGLKVLIVDFDLEAPGLERFLDGPEIETSYESILASRGVLDLVFSYKTLRMAAELSGPRPEAVAEQTSAGGDADGPPDTVGGERQYSPLAVEPLTNFVVPIYSPSAGPGALGLIPAGRRIDDEYSLYAERVRSLDWDDFYLRWDGERFFDWFVEETQRLADVVLIDSRTGITEMSGVCTHHLADSVVLFVAPNQQNLDGIRKMAQNLRRPELINKGRKGRSLSVLIVPSRVEPAEGDKLDDFADRFQTQLAGFIEHTLVFQTSAFVDLRIPYIPYYAYMENVAVRQADKPKSADLIAAYNRLTSAMVELAPKSGDFYATYHSAQAVGVGASPAISFPPAPADFVGREYLFRQIGSWLKANGPRAFVLRGEPGSGKTAIAARLVDISAGRVEAPRNSSLGQGEVTFAYACRGHSDEGRGFVRALAEAIAARHPAFAVAVGQAAMALPGASVRLERRIGATESTAQQPSVLRSLDLGNSSASAAFQQLVLRPLEQIYAAGFRETVLIVIDALDAANRVGMEESLLGLVTLAVRHEPLPPQVRLLITSRPDPRILQAIPGLVVDILRDPEALEDVRQYAKGRLAMLPGVQRRLAADVVAEASDGNVLYARMVLDAVLKEGGDPVAAVRALVDQHAAPAELRDSYRAVLASITDNNDRWPTLAPLLGVLAVARGDGLTVPQLSGIVALSRSDTLDGVRAISAYLETPAGKQSFRPFHISFANFLLTDPDFGLDPVAAHFAVASYFADEYEGRWRECHDEYALHFTLSHFLAGLELAPDRRTRRSVLPRVHDLLTALDYLEVALKRFPVEYFIQQVGRATELAAAEPMHDDLRALDLFLQSNSKELDGWDPLEQPTRLAELVDEHLPEIAKLREQAAERRRTADRPSSDSPREPLVTLSSPVLREPERYQFDTSTVIGMVQRGRLFGLLWFGASVMLSALLTIASVWPQALPAVGAIGLPAQLLTMLAGAYSVWCLRYGRAGPRALPESLAWPNHPSGISLWDGGRRFRVLGFLEVASPFFELATLCYVAATLVSLVAPATGSVLTVSRLLQ